MISLLHWFSMLSFSLVLGNMVPTRPTSTIADFFPEAANDKTKISWAHAVNDLAYLQKVLKSDIMMLEADIVMGVLEDDPSGDRIPVMGHPPADKSDISLEQFLTMVNDHNAIDGVKKKGVKLDFKSIEVFEDSRQILNFIYGMAKYPIWLNADILPGPVDSAVVPVDALRFLSAAANYPSSVLSIGWTTLYGGDIIYGTYSESQINEMLSTVERFGVANEVTFPMRAGIAATSIPQISFLLKETSQLDSTLTIWSSEGDFVNIDELRRLILSIGLDKVFLDVPAEVSDKLNL